MSVLDNIRARKAKEPTAASQLDAAQQDSKKGGKRGKRKPDIINIVLISIMVLGLGIIAYPTFSDWWNQYHQSRAIASYVAAVEETDPKVLEQMLADARDYNQRLLQDPNRYIMTDAERAEYESLLNLTGDGVMGYIQIKSIGVNLPVYHGVDEGVLQVAIGHIEGSSLPVGGPSTHAAVSGHRGLPSAKLFTDIDRLTEGDTFTITVLNQTITYEVDQIRIVLPENMRDLEFVPGADYCTLITCTPYGVNTHRLLVRGHRVDNINGLDAIPADAIQIPNYIAVPAVAVPMLFVYLLGMLIHYRLTRRTYDKEEVMKALAKMNKRSQGAAAEAEAAVAAEPEATAETEPEAAAETTAEPEPEVEAAPAATPEPEPAVDPKPEPDPEPQEAAPSEQNGDEGGADE